MNILACADFPKVSGGVILLDDEGMVRPTTPWTLDASETRPPGTNSWGEATGGAVCTQQYTVEVTTTETAGPTGCVLSTAAPFFGCNMGATRTQTTVTKNTITCTR